MNISCAGGFPGGREESATGSEVRAAQRLAVPTQVDAGAVESQMPVGEPECEGSVGPGDASLAGQQERGTLIPAVDHVVDLGRGHSEVPAVDGAAVERHEGAVGHGATPPTFTILQREVVPVRDPPIPVLLLRTVFLGAHVSPRIERAPRR